MEGVGNEETAEGNLEPTFVKTSVGHQSFSDGGSGTQEKDDGGKRKAEGEGRNERRRP